MRERTVKPTKNESAMVRRESPDDLVRVTGLDVRTIARIGAELPVQRGTIRLVMLGVDCLRRERAVAKLPSEAADTAPEQTSAA